MRPNPAAQVVAWLDEQSATAVWVSAISRAEIELGLTLIPEGKQQAALVRAAEAMFNEDFAGRCLPCDEAAASHHARLAAARLQRGRPMSVEDAQIAAAALAHDMRMTTRNAADFEWIGGLLLIHPWETV